MLVICYWVGLGNTVGGLSDETLLGLVFAMFKSLFYVFGVKEGQMKQKDRSWAPQYSPVTPPRPAGVNASEFGMAVPAFPCPRAMNTALAHCRIGFTFQTIT